MESKLIIPISDLMYIFEISKALKQKDFIWYLEYVIGIDSEDYIIYTKLDLNKISIRPQVGLIINQRELSKFMKSITTEFDFSIDIVSTNFITLISTMTETLKINVNLFIAQNKLNNIISVEFNNLFEQDVSESIGSNYLYNMTKSSGIKMYQYDNQHILTLFGGLMPLAKSDKLYLAINDHIDGITFLARFRVHKKITDIIVIIRYIKL